MIIKAKTNIVPCIYFTHLPLCRLQRTSLEKTIFIGRHRQKYWTFSKVTNPEADQHRRHMMCWKEKMYCLLDMDYIGHHQLHTVHITIEMIYTYLEWVGGVGNMPYLLLLFTASTTCKSRSTMIEILAWTGRPKSEAAEALLFSMRNNYSTRRRWQAEERHVMCSYHISSTNEL